MIIATVFVVLYEITIYLVCIKLVFEKFHRCIVPIAFGASEGNQGVPPPVPPTVQGEGQGTQKCRGHETAQPFHTQSPRSPRSRRS